MTNCSDKRNTIPFSIIIPTWNNLGFLKLCVRSLRENSTAEHQVIIHVNDGTDGTLEWLRNEGVEHTRSGENIGICFAMNMARALVKHGHILYVNDDMYALPGWDAALSRRIAEMGGAPFYLSATMIEPYPSKRKHPPVIYGKNFGMDLASFEEARLLREYMTFEKPDWSGSTRPPALVPRDLWDKVGGYSIELSPGLYSDPDFSMKLWKAGVRNFIGAGDSRFYHFGSKSLNRITPNNGRKQFLQKWGVSSSIFERFYLRLGEIGSGKNLSAPDDSAQYRMALLRLWLKKLLGR